MNCYNHIHDSFFTFIILIHSSIIKCLNYDVNNFNQLCLIYRHLKNLFKKKSFYKEILNIKNK